MDNIPMITFLLLFPFLSHAFRLDPMVVNLSLTSPKASGTYTVENNTKEKVALQFEVKRRVIDIEGKEERPEAKGFLIYPEQMSLNPGERRNVRITWVCEAMPSEELPFRFVASQLPIDFQKEGGAPRQVKLRFLIEYVASLYLTPPKATPKPRVLKTSINKNKLEILVANEGNAHFLLERTEITLKSKNGKTLKVSGEPLQNIRTENLLPGGKRILKIPLPNDFPEPIAQVNFEP